MNSLVCFSCAKYFPLDTPLAVCPCGGYFDIEFNGDFYIHKHENPSCGMWKYKDSLPLGKTTHPVSLGEPLTALVPLEFLGRIVHVKQEQQMPTGSFKDRGASLLITKAKALGIGEIVEDSSGNAGCALAAYSARAGIKARIFVPETASVLKLAQIRAYGAELNIVKGSRGNAERAAIEASSNSYYASHSRNPFFLQGVKTIAYEICEQLDWRAPDAFIAPAGNGTLILGAWAGFNDLFRAGLILKLPRIIAVQAENCAPLHACITGKESIEILHTIAEGIAVENPVRLSQMKRVLEESRGMVLTVTEEELLESHQNMARRGFWIEPTSAAVIPAIMKYLEKAGDNELVVSVFTGHGSKSTIR